MAAGALKIASVQFESASGDKEANLATIKRLATHAASRGAQVVAFHETSISGYTFASRLTRNQLLDVAEPIPDGSSVQALIQIAGQVNVVVLAGLFEKDLENLIFFSITWFSQTLNNGRKHLWN